MRICYYNTERTEFSMRVGDEPVELNAQFTTEAIPSAAEGFVWTSSAPDCLEVSSTGDAVCTVTALKAKESGVTLSCKYGEISASVVVNITA